MCVNEQNDVYNCGTCGNVCPISCTNGSCLKAVGISAGIGGVACAALSDGTARCWGNNYFGNVGNGQSSFVPPIPTTYAVPTPTPVGNLSGAKSVSVGYGNSCAILTSGSADCWGDNQSGELGNGKTGNTLTFLSAGVVPGLSNVNEIEASGGGNVGFSTCALVSGGSVYCWGSGAVDQLGIPSLASGQSPSVPSQATVTNATSLAVGTGFACAVVAGTVDCWGANGIGELGNGSQNGASAPSPTPVTELGATAIGVAAGGYFACALLTGNSVRCWGANFAGELGESSLTYSYVYSPADPVSGLSTVAAMSAGNDHMCVLTSSGTVQCWGDNGSGELGNGTTTNSLTAVTVVGLQGVTQVAAGLNFTCALTSGGSVYCWGDNSYGAMGNGTTSQTPQTTPALVKW